MKSPAKIAIVGANGFIGSRLVECFHLEGGCSVVPIVRSVGGLARLARFDLDWKIADARDVDALARAFAGCDAVVHAVVGDPSVIAASAGALIPAASRAGIRRVVYLSTASVHGQAPACGTDERSVLSVQQDYAYNNAKVRAERRLFADSRKLAIEFIALRPSVVFGPRDQWISQLCTELQAHTAWLIDEGGGVCNSVYVDNLIHAIRLSLNAPETACGRAYLITDDEPVTWRRLYETTCELIGVSQTSINQLTAPKFPSPGWRDRIASLHGTAFAQGFIAGVPSSLKRVAKASLKAWPQPPRQSPWSIPGKGSPPRPDRERVRLQQCAWRLPCDQAKIVLGYAPVVPFEEGLQRTVAWLRWAGRLMETESR